MARRFWSLSCRATGAWASAELASVGHVNGEPAAVCRLQGATTGAQAASFLIERIAMSLSAAAAFADVLRSQMRSGDGERLEAHADLAVDDGEGHRLAMFVSGSDAGPGASVTLSYTNARAYFELAFDIASPELEDFCGDLHNVERPGSGLSTSRQLN